MLSSLPLGTTKIFYTKQHILAKNRKNVNHNPFTLARIKPNF